MSLVVDIHALQTLPPNLINRDDVGSPKTAIFGGVPRQRVSSQAWKRAMRKFYGENVSEDQIGERSKFLPELIARRAMEINPALPVDDAIEGLKKIFNATGSKNDKIKLTEPKVKNNQDVEGVKFPETEFLLFMSKPQIEAAASILASLEKDQIIKTNSPEIREIFNTSHSVDLAAFGRMIAGAQHFNVDAAVQVAHALSVHEAAPEFDFFTAIDDVREDREESGAGMIGTIQLMSSTLYRYATINVKGLKKNLGSEDHAIIATGHLIRAFIESMPTGKINTFANQTLPELVYVTVRDTRPVSLVNAFEEPVAAEGDKGRRAVAAERLARESREIAEQYGLAPTAAFVIGLGDLRKPFEDIATATTLMDLPDQVKKALRG